MELAVHQDKILNSIEKFKEAEASRNSDAATTRAEIGKLTELTGVHPKAFAMVRQLDKAPEERREDILRSFDALRGILEPAWNGQSTPDMLGTNEDELDADGADENPPIEEIIADAGADTEPDAEQVEFDAAVDAADSNIVTPINFGGAKAIK